MKNENSKNIFLDKYIYVNYFLVVAFIILNLLTEREYRNIISIFFIIIMLPLFFFKIKNDLHNDKENKTKLVQNTIIKMLIIFGILVTFYFIS